MPSTKDVTSIDSMAVQGYSNIEPFHYEHQKSDRCTTRAPSEWTKKNEKQRQVEFPEGRSPIPADRNAAMGGWDEWSFCHAIDRCGKLGGTSEKRITSRLEDDRIFKQFRQERARMVAESEARLLEVRRQAEQERPHYRNQL